jgi:hypothetical protein
MEAWDLRDGEVWVDCEAADAAFESAKTNYGKKEINRDLFNKGLLGGQLSRIRGRADKKRQKYARILKTNVINFAAACRVGADLIMVDKATVRKWMEANPPDKAEPESDQNLDGETEPDKNPDGEPVLDKSPSGEPATDQNPVEEPVLDRNPDGESVSDKNPSGESPDQATDKHLVGEPASEKNPSGDKKANKSSHLIIAAAAILAIAALAVGAWKTLSGQSLAISQLRVFDDSYRKGQPGHRTLTELHKKSAAFYEITTTDDFLLSLGFVISGYAKKPDGSINVEAIVSGKGVDSIAWHVDYKFTRPDEWMEMDASKSVGAPDVRSQFSLRDPAAFPVIALIECAQVYELAPWTGGVEVKVIDHVGDKEANDSITINLNKTGNLKPPSNCVQKP